jgi:hypothetical protein
MLSIGIDNGLNGALVAIDDHTNIVGWYDCPILESSTSSKGKKKVSRSFNVRAMVATLSELAFDLGKDHSEVRVWLEVAHAMPKQGISSTFKTGYGAGLWEGIVCALGLSYDVVHAKTWSKEVLRDVPRGDPKHRSFVKTQRLFPDLPLMKPNGRVLSMDGRSDASLIAYYGMLKMKGGSIEPEQKKPVSKKKPVRRVGKQR